ncbi:hypothetical protein ACSBR2_024746 [Camellia fascicularis]
MLRNVGIMVPRCKTGRWKRATSGNILSAFEACPQKIGTPLTFSDEMQPPDDTQTVVDETQPGGVGQTRSTRVRRPTLGKGVQNKITRRKGEKLHIYVNRVLNSVKSWRKIDQPTKDAVIQAVLDKFVIGDDFDNDEQAQQILDRKAYLLYKDWRYNLNHPPNGVSLEDWKYMIDVAWKDESHLKRSRAGKANRGMLSYNHTSGSRSFPIAMSLMANEDGDIDFPKFYKKAHKSKKTGDWIDPKCGELHDDMVNLQVTTTDTGLPLTHEEISRQVLREQHQSDHQELLKEKKERQRDREELLKEKEKRQRDREEITREREQLIKQVDEEKKARKAQQVQLNHLNDVVSRLTTLLEGSDGHPTIR